MIGTAGVTVETLDQWYFSVVKRSARRQDAVQNGSQIIFPLCWQIKAAALFSLAGCGLIDFVLIRTKPIPGDPWYLKPILLSIVGALAVAILFALPGRVVIDPDGIRQRYWWRRDRHVPWSDFASVIRNRNDGSTIVYGKFENPIVFSPYLVDQLRFDREVKAFTHTFEIRDDL
jgi:PH (Pleckstrin Homology) domain-containing protein